MGVYAVLLFVAYRSSLTYLVGQWKIEDFNYCAFVPFIAIYLVWEKRSTLEAARSVRSWKGCILLSVGLIFYWLGDLGSEYTMQFISLWLVLISLCWIHLGWQKLKIISFPLAFSFATFVPPHFLYDPLTLKMKLISSKISVLMMQLYGLSAYREGNVIDLGFTRLQVVDACSGLRYVIPLFLMGVLMAYYFRAQFWKKAFLVFSTVPLSIITNSFRIASVGILYQFWGVAAAEGFFHDFSGWFIFMTGLALLLLEIWVLKKILPEKSCPVENSAAKTSAEKMAVKAEFWGSETAGKGLGALLSPPQFPVVVGLLLMTILVGLTVDFREKRPLVKPFSEFPLQIGEWTGSRGVIEREFLDALKLSDYALVNYRNPEGKEISLYVAYNASQSKGEGTHSPSTCLPGSGWVFQESGTRAILSASKEVKTAEISRAFMEKNGIRKLVYFWFPQRGRDLTSLYQVKFFNFWDALTKQRTDGALVRIITPLYQNEQVEQADNRMLSFTGETAGILKEFIPQ